MEQGPVEKALEANPKALELLNEIAETHYTSWAEISRDELIRYLFALLVASRGANEISKA